MAVLSQSYLVKFPLRVLDITYLDLNTHMRGTALRAMVSWFRRDSKNKKFIAVFIYSMPGYSVSIKERMLYSSCKNSVVDVLEKVYSIIINKKIEVDSGAELTEEYLLVRTQLG